MKTLDKILANNEPFTLSKYDNIVYNAEDHENHKKGKDAKGRNVFTRIYSVYAVNLKEGYCFTQCYDVWGRIWDETHNLNELTTYNK